MRPHHQLPLDNAACDQAWSICQGEQQLVHGDKVIRSRGTLKNQFSPRSMALQEVAHLKKSNKENTSKAFNETLREGDFGCL